MDFSCPVFCFQSLTKNVVLSEMGNCILLSFFFLCRTISVGSRPCIHSSWKPLGRQKMAGLFEFLVSSEHTAIMESAHCHEPEAQEKNCMFHALL